MREKLTLILFKDHLTTRTLKLPLQWLPRLGFFWLIAMFLTLFTSGIAIHSYLRGNSSAGGGLSNHSQDKIDDLEKQLSELKTSYEALQARSQGGTSAATSTLADATGGNFTGLPQNATRTGLPTRDTLPFRLESLKAVWRGNTLNLSTAIEYTKDDGGNQQGHFVIIARGPQNLYVYPDGALSPAGSDTLIKPEAGEYFSVSRYREIKAAFGPALTRDSIQSVEVYIFDTKKNLIYIERTLVEAPKARAPSPSPVPSAAPAPSAAAPAAPGAGTSPIPTPPATEPTP